MCTSKTVIQAALCSVLSLSKMTPVNSSKLSFYWEADIFSNDEEICLLWNLQFHDVHKYLCFWI